VRLPELSRKQRLEVAQVSGTVERMLVTAGPIHVDDAVAEVRAVSRDPLVLGQVLGAYVVRTETEPRFAVVAELLREAGADEERAEQVAAWQRWRHGRDAQADGPIL
jgi:hypothetical protein